MTDNPGWKKRRAHTSLVFGGRMWLIGGTKDTNDEKTVTENDVWYSQNGKDWIQATNAAPWVSRYHHTSVVFDNKMWVIGGTHLEGKGKEEQLLNDVWFSEDGENWVQATDHAKWTARKYSASVVFDNRMWLIGGMDHGKTEVLNDVWFSEDGAGWTLAMGDAGFEKRCNHGAEVYDNKIWIVGGQAMNGYYLQPINSVWYTSDGESWTEATASADWTARRSHGLCAYDKKMWLLQGTGEDEKTAKALVLLDNWYTTDGVKWIKTTDDSPFNAHAQFSCLVF